jgi:2-polyprenyl-6-methoxyphenol hydroxylase-like FAD-dependent oxidoreductase
MQGKTEEIINNKLENETDCRVEWETRLESFTQDAESVTATVKNIKSNDEYTIRASYIIGADGSHSAVRKCTPGWTFEGVAIRTKFILADLTLTGDDIETFSHRMNAFNLGNSEHHFAYIILV